jgi:DNA-binding NarL/FixJ family response regulator
VIRVAVLDDHPAVLSGLSRLLEGTGDVALVAAAGTADELLRALDRVRADVAVLDYDLGRTDGLLVCHRLKERVLPPAVVVYSAYAGPALAFAARIAGAEAVVDKRAPASELTDAIRRVAAGGQVLPEVPLEVRHDLVARLDPGEVPVAAMLLAGTPPPGIAEALAIDRRDVANRTRRIVARLRPRRQPYDLMDRTPDQAGASAPARRPRITSSSSVS